MADRWPALLTRNEVAEYLGVSARVVSQLKAAGKIRSVKLFHNSHPMYRRAEIDEFVESLEYGNGFCAATQPQSAKGK